MGEPITDSGLGLSQAWAPRLCTRAWHLPSLLAWEAPCRRPTSLLGTPSRASWWSFPVITCLTLVSGSPMVGTVAVLALPTETDANTQSFCWEYQPSRTGWEADALGSSDVRGSLV